MFAAVAFVPGVGWIISGIYTVVDTVCVVVTGDKMVTYMEKQVFNKWVEFNRELKNWINSFVPGYYGYF